MKHLFPIILISLFIYTIPSYCAGKQYQFDRYGYSITCTYKNKCIVIDSPISIETKESHSLIGTYIGNGIIKGTLRYDEKRYIDGTFRISNNSISGLSLNKKEAGQILIECIEIERQLDVYNEIDINLEKKIGQHPASYSLNIPYPDCIISIPIDTETIKNNNGRTLTPIIQDCMKGTIITSRYTFTGDISNLTHIRTNYHPIELLGEKIFKDGHIERISFENNSYFVSRTFVFEGHNVGMEECQVPSKDFETNNFWNIEKYFGKGYRQVLRFSNGDSFIGDIQGKWSYGCPLDGITEFKDGTKAEGDWVTNYPVSPEIELRLKDSSFPSETRFILDESLLNKMIAEFSYFISSQSFVKAHTILDDIATRFPKNEKIISSLKEELSISEKLSNETIWGRILFFDCYSKNEHINCWDLNMPLIYLYDVSIQNRTYAFKFGKWEISEWSKPSKMCSFDRTNKTLLIGDLSEGHINYYVQYELSSGRINILKKEKEFLSNNKYTISGQTFIDSPVDGKYRLYNYQDGSLYPYFEFSISINGDICGNNARYNIHHKLIKYGSNNSYIWKNGRIAEYDKYHHEHLEYLEFNEQGYWTKCRVYQLDKNYPDGIKYICEYQRVFSKK